MRAPLIVVILAVVAAGGYYFFQHQTSALPEVVETASAQSAAPVRPSDGAALTVFNDICIDGRANYAQTESRALAAGWSLASDDVNPNVARIMSISRGASVPQASEIVINAYAHPERPQFIVLTGMNLAGNPVNGCYVYDFAAPGLPELSPFETSLGAPTEIVSEPGVIDSKKWVRPALFPSVATLRMGYFPPGSPAEPQVGYSGLVLALTSMSR